MHKLISYVFYMCCISSTNLIVAYIYNISVTETIYHVLLKVFVLKYFLMLDFLMMRLYFISEF